MVTTYEDSRDDSLAYIDQMAVTPYDMNINQSEEEQWFALDEVSGM